MNKLEYTSEIIEKMQFIEYDMLCELDRICKKNNISYQLDGGTFLGAVRHKGFIPWDDDIDVRMLRSEYERFCEVCKRDLDESKYFLQNHDTDPGFLWAYARILRVGTSFYRENQEMLTMKRGIFIDIFPFDCLPNKIAKKFFYNIRCFWARKILYSRVGAVHERNIIKRVGYKIVRTVSVEYAYKMIGKLAHENSENDSERVRVIGCAWAQEKSGYPIEYLKESAEYEFNGKSFPSSRDYNGMLTLMYGSDYMTLPPEEKRVPKHTAVSIDFGDV